MAELTVGKALHDNYINEKKPKLLKFQAKLKRLQAIKNPEPNVLKQIAVYQRCIDSINFNIWLIEEVYSNNKCKYGN